MQSTIDQHLGNLLYYHECVVVPNFGAFLTRYFPAEINSATHMMRPPSKRVAFNARVNENDGLLAKHIAAVDGVSYEKAIESIEISVRSWKKVLRAGKKVNLIGIGRLYMDSTGKLQFNPAHDINYDLHSYGLNIFRANAMEREAEIKKSVNKAIEKHQGKRISTKSKSPAKGEKSKEVSKTNWLKWVATLGPVAALLLVGSYYYTQEREAFNNVSGLVIDIFDSDQESKEGDDVSNEESSSLSFEKAERLNKDFGPEDDMASEIETDAPKDVAAESATVTDMSKPVEPSVIKTPEPKEQVAEKHEDPAEATIPTSGVNYDYDAFEKPLYNVKRRPDSFVYSNGAYDSENSSPYKTLHQKKVRSEREASLPKHKAEENTVKAEPKVSISRSSIPPNTSISTQGNFQIIVGAFSDLNNARKYVAQLEAEGFQAYISENGKLNRVAIGSFANANEASGSLSKIKREITAGAWLNAL